MGTIRKTSELTLSRRADFARYHATRDPSLRDQLVRDHLSLAYSLARRYAGRGEGLDDLRQVAAMSLLHAVERFDPGRGLAFSSFATPTIDGTLKRHFRDRVWTVRPPRPVQERALEAARLEEHLTHERGRVPTAPEVAEVAGWGVPEAREALDAVRVFRRNGHVSVDDVDVSRGLGGDDPEFERLEQRFIVQELLDELSASEREVLRLRYAEELSQEQIGQRIGVSQMQVSRMLKRALARLHATAGERMSA